MKNNDQIMFQVKTTPEGKNRVYLKSWEDREGDATLASVIAADFRLGGTDGEGLSDALNKLHELDKRYDKVTNTTTKEAKAAHRRMDQAFPTLDSRLSSLEDSLAQTSDSISTIKDHLKTIEDSILKIEKNMAELNYENDHLTDLAAACDDARKCSESRIDDLQAGLSSIENDVTALRKFNDKVVLFYSDDEAQ